jgi:hypothetical protein
MTKVELYLYDAQEMVGFAHFFEAVLARRAKLAANLTQTPVPQQTSVPNEEVVEAIVEAQYESSAPETVAAAAQAEVLGDEPVSVMPKDIFNAYLNAQGFKNARAKLDAFGVKTFKEITPEQMPAFLASLSAPVSA